MPRAPQTYRPGGVSAADRRREYDRERGSAADRLYDARWAKAAKAFLRQHPLCRYCQLEGYVTAATTVDHFWPHRRKLDLFWRREFWVASCAGCHSGLKQATERAGLRALQDLAARLGFDTDPPGGFKSLRL